MYQAILESYPITKLGKTATMDLIGGNSNQILECQINKRSWWKRRT
jgi:hypothetical protein